MSYSTSINGQSVKLIKRKSGDYLVVMLGRRGCNFIAKDLTEVYSRLK